MKTLLKPALYGLISFLIGSCGNPTDGASFKATVNGQLWTANASIEAINTGMLTINGLGKDGQKMMLKIIQSEPGIYNIGETGNTLRFINAENVQYFSSDEYPGTLQIQDFDPLQRYIKGNFSGELRANLGGSVYVSDGSFEVIFAS